MNLYGFPAMRNNFHLVMRNFPISGANFQPLIRYVHACAPGQNGIEINVLTYLLIAVSDFVACEIEISCTIALLKLSLLYYTLLTVLI